MKSATILAFLFALFSSTFAELYITIPDKDSTWYTGSTGLVQWNTSATEFGLLCNIQLISVATTQVAMNLTNSSVPCSVNSYTTPVLPAFENDKFLIRIGISSNSSVLSYTQNFNIEKNSTIKSH